MQDVAETQATWLQQRVRMPNIARGFPDLASDVSDGVALIFHPDGKGSAVLVARIKIEDWSHLRQ
jgi:hypothetical protein